MMKYNFIDMMLKRFFLFCFILALLISSISAFASHVRGPSLNKPEKSGKYFNDVPENHPFASSINVLKERSTFKGYTDGTFKPDFSISRAEFITMVVGPLFPKVGGANCFADVGDEWFSRFVCSAKTFGFIQGYPDGTFKPYHNINLAEASAILTKAYKFKRRSLGAFDPWYKPSIQTLEARGAIPTSIDYVDKKLSRAEVAEMIWRLKEKYISKPTKTYAALTSDFPTVGSCPELEEKLKTYSYQQSRRTLLNEDALHNIQLAPVPTGALKSTEVGAPAPDYSATNVQVEGVDEADIVKNDGEFIYLVSGNTVRVIKAFPPDQLSELAKLKIDEGSFSPTDLYLSKNKLVIIGNKVHRGPIPLGKNNSSEAIIPPYKPYIPRTKMVIFDMSDKTNPQVERTLEFDGSQISSRRIGNFLYLVLNNTPDYYFILEGKELVSSVIPSFLDSRHGNINKPIVDCSKIHFLPRYSQPNFLVVAGINIENSSSAVNKEVIMGAGRFDTSVYAGPENLYIASQRYFYPEVGIFDIWAQPSYGSEKTSLFRFNLTNGEVKYKETGEIKGRLLNQFSMDEYENTFRVATTTGEVWNRKDPSKNHLFILDRDNLNKVLGSIEDIAPGERIYSVRFMGKRAYMVTFKKIDPFFVIDVENPVAPKILGALKIPGYSDYLHPFDENHIIGFGKEAADPQEIREADLGRDFDFAWYQGMKIALFDVTDVANPKVLFKELIGDRGTESEVFHNHKALLYDKTRGLFSFPVTVAEIKNKTGYTGSEYGQAVFQGAYVYTLNLQDGFKLKGKITHYNDPSVFKKQGYYWYDDKNSIKRIVYIGNFLYTLSQGKVKAVKREDMQEIKTIELEGAPANEPPMIYK